MTEAEALLQIEVARKGADEAHEALYAAEAQLLATRRAYAKARPLTEAERDALAQRVEHGYPLCCKEGRTWLSERLPPFWVDALSGWAYEQLACSEKRPRWLREYAEKVRRLALDELPLGTET
jgi:hypothetical protein